jgi:uncharacterized protein
MENLERLRRMDEAWYDANVSTTCVLTEASGCKRTFDFFSSGEGRRLRGLFTVVSGVDPVNFVHDYLPEPDTDSQAEETDLYCRFLQQLTDGEFDVGEEEFLKSFFQHHFLRLYKRSQCLLGDRVPINGMCVPGWRKIFVDADGNMHPCERTNRSFPIGHVDTGLDRERVREVLQCQVDSNERLCVECWAVRLCSCCLASLNGNGCIDEDRRNQHCVEEKASWENSLAQYCAILEENPSAFDYMEHIVIS